MSTTKTFLGVVAVIFLAAQASLACPYCAPPSVSNSFELADAVFIGQVVRGEERYGDHTFRVEKAWKGIQDNRVVISARGFESDYAFQLGEVYVVYAQRSGDELFASRCGGTLPLLEAGEQLKDLRDRPATSMFRPWRSPYLTGYSTLTLAQMSPPRRSFWNIALVSGFFVSLFMATGFVVTKVSRRFAFPWHDK